VNYTTRASQPTVSGLLETMRLAVAKMDVIRKQQLQRSAELVEQTTCGVCGRKPTVIEDRYGGETIVVCPHIWEALQKYAKPAELIGVRFEVFDDGPARW
jgi:hypothetical protein